MGRRGEGVVPQLERKGCNGLGKLCGQLVKESANNWEKADLVGQRKAMKTEVE